MHNAVAGPAFLLVGPWSDRVVNHGREAGTAASVLGAINMGLAGLVAPIVGMLGGQNAVPMGSVMAVTAMLAIVSLWFVVRTVPALVG